MIFHSYMRWFDLLSGSLAIENVLWSQTQTRLCEHTVHTSTRCHLLDGSARVAILFFWSEESRKCHSQSEAKAANLFSDWPEKHKIDWAFWDLASCQVLLNSVQQFQRRSRKCLSQSEARAAILFFWSARKTKSWQRMLRSCCRSSFVGFSSVVSEKKSKMWKVNNNRSTDDRQREITIEHLSFWLRCTKN